jgi:RimJ/RimL family protein N-acetyltransferase
VSGPAITLREWREDDLEEVVRLTNDPEIPRWTRVPEPNTLETAREWFARRPPDELHLCVADPETGEILGSVGLLRGDAENGRAEIGYWVAGEHRGRGVATAAVEQIARRAFADGWHRLELHIDPENAASRRVAEKAGFALEGVLRGYELIKDRRADVAMYARIASAVNG